MLAALLAVLWSLSNGVEHHTFPPITEPVSAVRFEVTAYNWILFNAENRSNGPAVATCGQNVLDEEGGTFSCLRAWASWPPTLPVIFDVCDHVQVSVPLAAFDGAVDFAGPSGFSGAWLTATHYSVIVTDQAQVAALSRGEVWIERVSGASMALTGGSGIMQARTSCGLRAQVWAVP